MQVTETLNEGLKRGYKITLTAQELDNKVNEKLTDAKGNISIKGFRKGKAPMALLKKMYGKSVLGEAMQESIDGALQSHLSESGDRPAQQPEVKMTKEDWKEGDDVEVEVSYERLPDIPDVDYGKLKLNKLVVEPSDKDIDEALEKLAENAQHFEPRKKGSKAKDGDQLTIDFKGSVDGVEFDGGSAEDFPLVLGSGSFIPGFEEQLVGAKVGDAPSVKVTFPEQYQAEHLAGKDAVFECAVKEVKEPKPAPIDDELAKKFGEEDLKSLRGKMSEQLGNEFSQASRMVMKRDLLDALSDVVDFELPPSMVEAEANQIAHQMWHNDNPDVEGHDHPEIKADEEHTKLAERRVRLGLLLADVGGENDIQVNEQEVQQAVFQQARQYPGQEQQFMEFVQQNPQMQQQISAPIFEDKVVDFIFELATVTDKKATKKKLEEAVEALEVA
jgi:trigger factor